MEIRAAGRWQAAGAAELWAGQAVQPFYEMPLRRGLRHAGTGRGAGACASYHGGGTTDMKPSTIWKYYANLTPMPLKPIQLRLANSDRVLHGRKISRWATSGHAP